MKKLLIAAVAVTGLVIVGCTADESNGGSNTSTGNEVSQGAGSKDAASDVKVISFEGPDAIGMYTAKVQVTNQSSKTSDYYIEANVEDAKGTVTDFTNGLVNKLQPGAQAVVDLIPVQASDGAKVVITEVQRTASS